MDGAGRGGHGRARGGRQVAGGEGCRRRVKDSKRRTALHRAAIRLLVEKGTDVEAKAVSGWAALHRVAGVGHEAVVRLSLEKGTNVKAKTVSGWTAVHWAASGRHDVVVQLLEAVR
jgi:ankyrin repeat protein